MTNEPTDDRQKGKLKNWLKSQFEDINQFPDTCGDLILQESFGIKSIYLYQKGYVLVRGFTQERNRNLVPEKLIEISFESTLSKKTGIGRGIAAIATAGTNFLLTNSYRGELIVTIVTDNTVHSMSHNVDSDGEIKAVQRLVTTGKALIEKNKDASSSSKSPVGEISVELEKLHKLFQDGVLNEEEFAKAKAKLLS
jgi:hypothetical protein